MDVAEHPNDVVVEGDGFVVVGFVSGDDDIVDLAELFWKITNVLQAAVGLERCTRYSVCEYLLEVTEKGLNIGRCLGGQSSHLSEV